MDYVKFEPLLGSWAPKMKPFIESKECDAIYEFLKAESQRGRKICPQSQDTYRAFLETPYEKLNVVFMLQDPYPWIKFGKYVADGIAMSCKNTGILQPSLDLFYDGMENDLYNGLNVNMVKTPDLSYLCNGGIMMLNTALTAEMNKPFSHTEIWKPFTKFLLEEVLAKYNNGLIFVLAGKQSQYFAKYINPMQHYIIEVEHPAAAAHKNRAWKHENVFSRINYILKQNNNYEPVWSYEEVPF